MPSTSGTSTVGSLRLYGWGVSGQVETIGLHAAVDAVLAAAQVGSGRVDGSGCAEVCCEHVLAAACSAGDASVMDVAANRLIVARKRRLIGDSSSALHAGGSLKFTECGIFTVVMKKGEIVNIKGRFEADALRVLREIPGLTVIAEPGEAGRRVDAILRFAGREAPIAVEFKARANAATARQLVHEFATLAATPLLLVADETTVEARAILEEQGIGVIDGLGNAHLTLPGLLFHLEGHRLQRQAAGPVTPIRLRGKAGIAAQALLLHPDLEWKVKDLAHEAGVATGLAHRVLARLEEEGVVVAEGRGPHRVRHVTNRAALLDLWAEEQLERPQRTLGHLLAQTPQNLIRQLASELGRAGIDYALTGAAAANLVAPFVTAVPVVEVWVAETAAPEQLGAAADPVAEGQNVVFLQAKHDTPLAFREHRQGIWLANRFRLYADLRRDPRRGPEQADHLREEVIGF